MSAVLVYGSGCRDEVMEVELLLAGERALIRMSQCASWPAGVDWRDFTHSPGRTATRGRRVLKVVTEPPDKQCQYRCTVEEV